MPGQTWIGSFGWWLGFHLMTSGDGGDDHVVSVGCGGRGEKVASA